MSGRKRAQTVPRASGVYQILCKPTGQIYVGSAVELRARWKAHRRALRQGEHCNRFLQAAWATHGEASFEFSVLEQINAAARLQAEQWWIDHTRCVDRATGFNICPLAGSPRVIKAQVWEGFIDPAGNEITIFNLQEFCRERDLDFPSMHRLAMGKSKLKSHKGWAHKNSIRQRDYIKTYDGFIDPTGSPVAPFTNLAAFCRERGLDKTHMVAVARGRICSHRGWTHRQGRQRQEKVHAGFINPNGQRVVITNLKAFCQEQGLEPVHMHEVKSGKRKSHKGWTWKENNE